ncbi:cell adhesion molecule 4-like isoform X2 [Salvelinus fontinalis]|uniref:cell adhesion molecule 4-like isoform X2 n=1 Tax=Salvelinus fontinalis TaxID=8038 RepID=UPI0024859DF5|nr:cell adhesion molecule 4-like isoform X2 [Salvelinus fontinalis]
MCLVVSRFVVCKKTPVNVVKQNQTHFRLYSRVNLRVHVTLISPRKRNIKKRSAGLSTMAFTAVWNYCAPLSVITLLSLVGTARCQAVQAENVTVLEGGTAEISCRLQKYDGSIVVIQNPRRQTLFFNGTRALKDDRFQMVLFTPRLVRITLTNVSVSDEGGYFCQLYTDDTHHQVATLSVSVPPDTPTVEVKQEAVEGGEVELTCLSPRSKPPATLRWIRDRREIPGVVSQQENGKTVSVSSTIRLPVERRDNGAAVSCEASHPALGGQKRVRHYRLDVHFAPTVRIIPPPGILREGDSLSLTCSITGNPLPRDVQWTRINDTLPERAEISGPTFQVSRLSQSHNGTYLCQAQNNYGRAADHYTLLVYDPGAVIETHSAVPYAVIGGILALLVFTVICVLIVTIWCSVRQKGSYRTQEPILNWY